MCPHLASYQLECPVYPWGLELSPIAVEGPPCAGHHYTHQLHAERSCARTHGPAFCVVLGVCAIGIFFFFVGVTMGEEDQSAELWFRNQFTTMLVSNSTECGNRTSCTNPRLEHQAHLRYLKSVTLTVVGFVGLLIIGCLCLCMFYKNERLLAQMPWRKKSRQAQSDNDIQRDYFSNMAQLALETGALSELNYREYATRQRDQTRPTRIASQRRHQGGANSPQQTPVDMMTCHHKHRHKPQDDHYLCVPVSGLDGLLSRGGSDFHHRGDISSESSDFSSYMSDISAQDDEGSHWSESWTSERPDPLPLPCELTPESKRPSSSSDSDSYCRTMSYPTPGKSTTANPVSENPLVEVPSPTMPHEYVASRL